jgi:hypothetical protein
LTKPVDGLVKPRRGPSGFKLFLEYPVIAIGTEKTYVLIWLAGETRPGNPKMLINGPLNQPGSQLANCSGTVYPKFYFRKDHSTDSDAVDTGLHIQLESRVFGTNSWLQALRSDYPRNGQEAKTIR